MKLLLEYASLTIAACAWVKRLPQRISYGTFLPSTDVAPKSVFFSAEIYLSIYLKASRDLPVNIEIPEFAVVWSTPTLIQYPE
jgi:hypothetical protein